jgi:putative OPT family oligopeptide transporter
VRSISEVVGARTSGEKSLVGMLALIAGIVVGFVAALYISGSVLMAVVGIVLALVLSMLFVIVSGRLTGIVGTSNLPVSGMTIASMVIMAMVFVVMSWTGFAENRTILLFGTFIVVAISSAGGYAQSHKATFILGGNKNEADRHFLIAGVIGVATVVGVIMLLSPKLAVIGDGAEFALPQANLMKTLTEGIMQGNLPWTLILAGVAMALFLFVLKMPIMTIAVGFYLPISTTTAVLLGGLLSFLISKTAKAGKERETKLANGVSLSAGLVAGTAIIGLIGIIMQVFVFPRLGIGGSGPAGFAAGNGMAYVIAVVLFGAILPILLLSKKE